MGLMLFLLLTQTVSVQSQSTQLDSQCNCHCRNDANIQQLLTMMESMRTEMTNMHKELKDAKLAYEILQNQVVDLESKLITQNNMSDTRINAMSKQIGTIERHTSHDCTDIRSLGYEVSGVYSVNAGDGETKRVYCEMTADGTAWTRIMHNQDNSTDFTHKRFADYAAGFGDPEGSHWTGLELMHRLTTSRDYKIRVDLTDWAGESRFAEYSIFMIGASSDKYRLSIGGYSGNAGDSMGGSLPGSHSLNNMRFTTIDQDNDQLPGGNCADGTGYNTGGWWYKSCFHCRLTGPYIQDGINVPFAVGIQWKDWRGWNYSYKVATMSISRL